MKLFRIYLALVMFTFAGTAIAADASEVRTDPKGLVTYTMPAGWSNERMKNGKHYTRKGKPDDPTILAVVPEVRDKYMTVESISEGRKKVHAAQNQKQVSSEVRVINGFDAWDAVFEAEIRGVEVMLHHCIVFTDTLMIDVHLTASKADYATYLRDLRAVVDSLRPLP